jgi:hypothetical protein
MTPVALGDRIRDWIGPAALETNADNAIKLFATTIAVRFGAFQGTAMLVRVNGSGPVPSYNPPTSPPRRQWPVRGNVRAVESNAALIRPKRGSSGD